MVLTSTHDLCFEQKYEKYQNFLSKKIPFFLVVQFSIYLNWHVFVMFIQRHTSAGMSQLRSLLIAQLTFYLNLYQTDRIPLGSDIARKKLFLRTPRKKILSNFPGIVSKTGDYLKGKNLLANCFL